MNEKSSHVQEMSFDHQTQHTHARVQVMQEMLDMLRDHQNNSHASRLELIIVWLLVVDCCLMLCQVSCK